MKIIRSSELAYTAASHEDPKNPGVLKKVLLTRDQLLAGRVQMVNWALLPKGQAFRRHYHEDMEEIFVIMNGAVEMESDGKQELLRDGDVAVIPPHGIHRMVNRSAEDVQYLVIGITKDCGGKTVVVE